MTPNEASVATAAAVTGMGSHFMLDGATYATGAELGFEGIDFYLAGRAGVLGAVDADVVSAALVFFCPTSVRKAWDAGAAVMPRHEAAAAFIRCGHKWARAHLADNIDWNRLSDLCTKIAVEASPAGAPLFAGWRAMDDLPSTADPKARALQQLNLLRELRMAVHGNAVVAAGIPPLTAVMVRTPYMAEIFGWSPPFPDPEPAREAWEAAEQATTDRFGGFLEVLDEVELADFVRLINAASNTVN